MFKSVHKLMAVCLVAVFSMMMYGCSSSSTAETAQANAERYAMMVTAAFDADEVREAGDRSGCGAYKRGANSRHDGRGSGCRRPGDRRNAKGYGP